MIATPGMPMANPGRMARVSKTPPQPWVGSRSSHRAKIRSSPGAVRNIGTACPNSDTEIATVSHNERWRNAANNPMGTPRPKDNYEGGDVQLHRYPHFIAQKLGYGASPVLEAFPEVATGHVAQVANVLHDDRVVQAPLLADPLHHRRVGMLAHQHLHRGLRGRTVPAQRSRRTR